MCWREYNCCSKCWREIYRRSSSKILICKKCGKEGKRANATCWSERGMCSKCVSKMYDKLICKKCGSTSRHTSSICWKENLCGFCYRREHSRNKLEPQYKMCKTCNERMVSLSYQKRGVHVKVPYYMCTKCATINVFEDKYKLIYISSKTINK